MGRARSFCFFVFLFATCNAQDLVGSEDLKSGLPILDEDELIKSAAHAMSFLNSDGGFSKGESHAEANFGSSLAQSLTSLGDYSSSSAQASAQANVAPAQFLNPFGLKELLGPALPGANSGKAKSEALALTNSVMNLYQGPSPYQPSVQLSPYNLGLSAQAQAEAQSLVNSGGNLYNQGSYPYYHGSGSGSSSSQAEAQALINYGGLDEKKYKNPSFEGNQYPFSPYSLPSPEQGQAEAQAFANADVASYSPEINTFAPGYPGNPPAPNSYQKGYPVNVKQNSALASAEVQALLNAAVGGNSPGMNLPGYQQTAQNSGLSMNQAEAQAVANADVSNYNPGLTPYMPGTGYTVDPKPNSAQASANTQTLINGGGGGYSPDLNSYQQGYLPVTPVSSQAEAQATANSGVKLYGYSNPMKNNPHLYQYGSNTAQAQAEAQSGAYGNNGGFPYVKGQKAQAMAEAQSMSEGQASAMANAQAVSGGVNAQGTTVVRPDTYSRLIPSHEYIMPHLIPGVETAIVCSSEGEMYNLWSPVYECLVCACIKQVGTLVPVCAQCDGCRASTIEPVIVPEPESVVTPELPTRNDITCSPLPSWQSFENPLHPCQICICKETLDGFGVLEAQITCTENQDCVLPADAAPLPPIPDGLPMPLPVCEKFPQNVYFPHPVEDCKICKCKEEMTQQGLLEPRITCIPDPECRSQTLPVPPVIPHQDLIIPDKPLTFPDIIVTPEPLPLVPVTIPTPIGPGPLPGPAPHESCRPFQPGQAFQHPWDECQVCMCTEARGFGLITIEVNCFTKKSCCYESPNEPVTPVSPTIYYTTPAVKTIDKLCEFKTIGVEFLHPQDNCKVCTCELFGGMISPSCKAVLTSECSLAYLSGAGSEIAEAQASAISQVNAHNSYLPSLYGPSLPSQVSLYGANTLPQTGYPGYSGYQSTEPYNLGMTNLLTKENGKLIQSPVTEPLNFNQYLGYLKPDLTGLSGYQSQQGYYQGNLIYPASQNLAGSADGDAMVNAYTDLNKYQIGLNWPGYNQYEPSLSYPVTNVYYPGSVKPGGTAASQGEASSTGLDQQTNYPGFKYQGIPGSSWAGNGIEGLNNILTGYNKLYYPSLLTNQGSSANAIGNAQLSGSGGESLYQTLPASSLYPTLYSKPRFEVTPLYISTPAQAQSLAQGLGSKNSAKALVNIGRTKINSEEEGVEIETIDDAK